MPRRIALTGLAVFLLGTAAACGSGGGNGPTGTPGDFERARDALVVELDNIGGNIGSVPDDIRDALIASCLQLESYVDKETIDRICPAIGQAVDANDPGTIDLVVEELAALEPD